MGRKKNEIIESFETKPSINFVIEKTGLKKETIIAEILNHYNCDRITIAIKIILALNHSKNNYEDVIKLFEETLKVKNVAEKLLIKESVVKQIILNHYNCTLIQDARNILINKYKIDQFHEIEGTKKSNIDQVISLFNKSISEKYFNIDSIATEVHLSPFNVKKIILNYYNCSSIANAKRISIEKKVFDAKQIDNIINIFKTTSSISKTSEQTSIPVKLVKKIVLDHFSCNDIKEVRKISGSKRQLSSKMKSYLMKANALYSELGSLEKVAEKLSVTRQRVQQLLTKGEKYGLFQYVKYSKQRFDELSKQIDKNFLEKILTQKNKNNILELLKISASELEKLILKFDIDYSDVRKKYLEKKLADDKQKCINDYHKIVNSLGEHPTTTFLNQNDKYRNIWSKINKYWGNIINFRNFIGVNEIDYKRGNKEYLRRDRKGRTLLKENNKSLVLEIITKIQPVSINEIHKLMNELSFGTIRTYLMELLDSGKIVKTYSGQFIYYVINSNDE